MSTNNYDEKITDGSRALEVFLRDSANDPKCRTLGFFAGFLSFLDVIPETPGREAYEAEARHIVEASRHHLVAGIPQPTIYITE